MPENKQGSGRGFGSMEEDKQREIASQGGEASGGNFGDTERAAEAGGGQQSEQDRFSRQGSAGGRGSDEGSGGDRGDREGGRSQQQGERGVERRPGPDSENDRESESQSDRRGGRARIAPE